MPTPLPNGTLVVNSVYVTPSAPLINDVFNLRQNKQISGLDLPQTLVITFSYVTPKLQADGTAMKAVSWLARDWTYSAVLRYQSGFLLPTPPSNNNLLADLGRGPGNNPALWGGRHYILQPRSGATPVPGGPQLPFRPYPALSAES